MANPQPTPFVRFSKELYEAFYTNPPSTVAGCRLWLWVLRWTWADFGKLETKERSLGQIAAEVKMSRSSVCRELAALVRCRRLNSGKEGGYTIQKDYELWQGDTKKRELHYGNKMRQERLFSPVDNFSEKTTKKESYPQDKNNKNNNNKKLSTDLPTVSNGETPNVSHGGINRFTVEQSTVSPYETPIRIKNTVENFEKQNSNKHLPNGKLDTPRNRADLGDGSYDPSDHPNFLRLGFKIQNDLADTWKSKRADSIKKNWCIKGCGRNRFSDLWKFCRPCTICSECGENPDSKRKFSARGINITCGVCKEKNDKR